MADELERMTTDAPLLERHAELARHWEAAGEPARAMRSYLTAARETADRYAGQEAEQLYRAALRLLDERSPEAASVRLELVERVLLPAGVTEEAVSEAAASLKTAEATRDETMLAGALRVLALAHQAAGRYPEGLDFARRARKKFEALGDRTRAAQMLEHMSLCASRLQR